MWYKIHGQRVENAKMLYVNSVPVRWIVEGWNAEFIEGEG